MKKYYLVLLFTITFCFANAQVRFDTSFVQSQETHKNNHKLFFIDFMAEWCGPCKQMDKNVFRKQEVFTLLNEKFNPVRLNIDSPEGGSLFRKFSFEVIPSILIIDANNNVKMRIEGYHSSKELIELLENVLKK